MPPLAAITLGWLAASTAATAGWIGLAHLARRGCPCLDCDR